jgi:tryptophan-rich sensory protein
MDHTQARTTNDTWRTVTHVVVAVCITLLAALPGLLVPEAIQGWYSNLVRPSFAPPNWLFGPVWTLLYWMMGISAGLVWTRKERFVVKGALALYGAQLLLNASWTLVFFGLHVPLAALIVIVALLVLIGLTMRAFFGIHRMAAWLLLPYLLWTAFATVLNAAYVWLN